jgi:hypothetical protein
MTVHPPPTLYRAFTLAFSGVSPAVMTNGPGGSVYVAARPNDSAIMNLFITELDARLAFQLSVPGQSSHCFDVIGMPLPPWAMYVGAVGWAWANYGHMVPGLDAVIQTQDGVQEGFVWETGLAFAAAWQDLGRWPLPDGGLLGLMARLGGFFRS